MKSSRLSEALARLSSNAASSVVARGRLASPGLNAALLRRLSGGPGQKDSFLADPVFEAALTWKSADCTLNDLSGGLLHPELVDALDSAEQERMPRDRRPWIHQLSAWQASAEGRSTLVSSGTGSGKTECFMLPILDHLLRSEEKGKLAGIRAILLYPLNALIESQRERLAAWTMPLKGRVSFALYNGLTPETPKGEDKARIAPSEIGNRRDIREAPPSILVTNVTMLEYMLLRTNDRTILERSQGLLRWIVLDEAHSYIGAQAAEMALLLRRVRAAFGVSPENVRLVATSATISEGAKTEPKLKRFVADLAGVPESQTQVIEGRVAEPELPRAGKDAAFDSKGMESLNSAALWEMLASHPRIQRLKRAMSKGGVSLTSAAEILFGAGGAARGADAQIVLDAAAQAKDPESGERLLPWRARLFHRSQGGIWVCVDPKCDHRDPELCTVDAEWGFGAVWLRQRDRCECGAPVFEMYGCSECGTPHLCAKQEVGAAARLVPVAGGETDEFAVDSEPDSDFDPLRPNAAAAVLLSQARNDRNDRFIGLEDGAVYDNEPSLDIRRVRIALHEDESLRDCCPGAENAKVHPQRYGPAFFMGVAVPSAIELLADPLSKPGLSLGGRRAITFTDSRQGTAKLAAKLQQEAERNLTRSFLYHAVQERRGPIGEERAKLEEKLAIYRNIEGSTFKSEIEDIEAKLAGGAEPVPWPKLVERFASHPELYEFAAEVWRDRARGGREMAENPRKLAEMFLYRELLRRPKVQNNAETMGLLRLSFPELESKAKAEGPPSVLKDAGIDAAGWIGLALAAVDFVFRENLAVQIPWNEMFPFISPRNRRQANAVYRPDMPLSERQIPGSAWPSPIPGRSRPSRLVRLVYELTGGTWDNVIDQDRAREALGSLWSLISTTAAKDIGGGAYQIDFDCAAVARLDQGWLCPVTRRIFGYSPADRSPYDPAQCFSEVPMPRLPKANPGGLDQNGREETTRWCKSASRIGDLREQGLWTDLHDRIATYSPFLRAQEHSAQIARPVLAVYEDRFKQGRINLLNCSTTMEMGVDIPNVGIVVNGNVPPSASNYRQRVGRAGRRGEPWAFAATFCRDLPLDRIVFDNPAKLLTAPVSAPAVRLDSRRLVARHVNAALLAAFLRDLPDGLNLKASAGEFFGASMEDDKELEQSPAADKFIEKLRSEWPRSDLIRLMLTDLTRGTALEGREAERLAGDTAEAFEKMQKSWRAEFEELLERKKAASASDAKKAFELRARRMLGEFLLGELARRGFTPSYGFPVDVVAFNHLSGHHRDKADGTISYGDFRGGASRTLDVAIREYAPGTEVVVDGLVHQSEGVFPAWGADADASKLEDLQDFWECASCGAFDLARSVPEKCPECGTPVAAEAGLRCLRPAGFLGRRAPHTGYDGIMPSIFEIPRISAAGSLWRALPDPDAGRMRADPDGQVVTLGSGVFGKGYALCLACGRAEPEKEERPGSPLPQSIKNHWPLAEGNWKKRKGGFCPGGSTDPQRIQRHVRFSHATRTDVFELQLAPGTSRGQGLALAAALREALAERLGTEAREIGVAVGNSRGPSGDKRVSALLHDRASGGAGFATRLAEQDWFRDCLKRALNKLACPEDCDNGCPSCVLRADIGNGQDRLDRKGARVLAESLQNRLEIPEGLRVFGPETRLLGLPLVEWLEYRRRTGRLSALKLYLHGSVSDWELAAWPAAESFVRMKESGVELELVLESRAIDGRSMDLARRLDLHRLAAHARLGFVRQLPQTGGANIVAVAEAAEESVAIATLTAEEAIPGPQWGQGTEMPLVRGPLPELATPETWSSKRLIELKGGNAQLIRVGKRLDGRAAEFGRAFWKLFVSEAPLIDAAMKSHGIVEAAYTDRYLRNPLSLRLLFEAFRHMPGRKTASALKVSSVFLDRRRGNRRDISDDFEDESARRQIFQELVPGAVIDIRSRKQVPHARSFRLALNDGRKITILLDQGFGAWRAQSAVGHDFLADPSRQARALKRLDFSVGVDPSADVPIIVQEE